MSHKNFFNRYLKVFIFRSTKPVYRFLLALIVCFSASLQAETLQQLIYIAIQNHPEIQVSASLKEASQADIRSARWQYYPTPFISAEAVSTSSDDQSFLGDDEVSRIGIIQPLWTSGFLTSNLQEAKASFSLSEAEFQQTEQSLALSVLSAYTDWYSANLRVQAWSDSVSVHENLSDQVRRRTSGGASSESDSALANARLAVTEAGLYAVLAEEQATLAVLSEFTGQAHASVGLALNKAQPLDIERSASRLVEQAKLTNPIVLGAQAEVDLADAEVRRIRAEQGPEINLRLERQHGNLGLADSDISNRVFIEFSTRFGAGLSSISNVSAASSRRDAARANVASQERSLDSSITSDLVLKASTEQQLVALSQSRQATLEVYDSFERQFLAGTRSWLDLLNSAREIMQLDLQIADAEAALVLLSWRLSILSEGLGPTLERL